jgi:hypothetical protein
MKRIFLRGTIVALAAAAACGSSGGVARDAAGDVDGWIDVAVGSDAGDGAIVAEYDLGADFSITSNPSGPWRYAHTRDATLAPDRFEADAFAVDSTPVRFWHPSDAVYYPYIAHNEAQTTVADPTTSWAVRPGEVAMEASQDAQYSVVQFVAAVAGQYEIKADFTGIHFRLSSTDVHVLHGDAAIFDAVIDGYGGDPAFHGVEGQSPQATYHDVRMVAAGDVLSFAVGVGQNRTYNNDTTGLFVHIVVRE